MVSERDLQRKGADSTNWIDGPYNRWGFLHVRELARTILADQGYSVLVAGSATDAEQIAAKGSREIHLLLTDVVMPGVSGRELARRITARNGKMQVLFMSGYTDNVIAHGGVLEAGVAFLQKPFTPRALTNKVRELLDRPVSAKK